MSEKGVADKVKEILIGTVVEPITEINKLIPDSILFGSLLLYFLTQNKAFGIFGIFIFETVLSHKLISWVSSQAVGESRSTTVECRQGFKTPRFAVERMFSHDQYPSYGLFSITAIATYLMMATKEFSSTMTSMGDEWKARAGVGYGLAATFIFISVLYFKFGACGTSTAEVMLAIILAFIVGLIFFYVNKALFGVESMNFLGLPYLVSKDSQGTPIYVCAADKSE